MGIWFKLEPADTNGDGAIDRSEWQPIVFPPHNVVLISGNSLVDGVAHYNVQFRDLRSKSGEPLSPPGIVAEIGLWADSVVPE